VENLKGRHHVRDLGVDGRITLEWILKKYIGGRVDWFKLLELDVHKRPLDVLK